ncbi:MFS transporter [Agaricicola taiwanensis]|nr:MFS transporter [Agaricicola taiwanensis]
MTGELHLTARQRTLALVAAMASISVVGASLGLSVPLLAFALEARGMSATFIGINTAMAGVAVVFFAPLIPLAAARLGVRSVMIMGLAGGAITTLAFYFIEPLWMWFPLRFLYGGSLAILFVLSEFWINAISPEKRRGLIMGVYATTLSLGFAAGPALLAVLGKWGVAPYAAGAILFVVAAAPILLAGSSAPRLPEKAHVNLIPFLLAAPAATLAALVFGAVETGGMTFVPLYGLAIGYSATASALLVSLLALGNVLVQIPIGMLSDRVDRRKLLLVLGLLGTAGAAGMPYVIHFPRLFESTIFIWGGLVAGLYTVGLAHLGSRFRGAQLASANAAFIVCYSIGMLSGPPLLGAGMDIWYPHGLPITAAVLFGLYSIVAGWRILRSGTE